MTMQTGKKRKSKSPSDEINLLTVIANQAATMYGIAALLSYEPHRHKHVGDALYKQANAASEYANRKLREGREESK